MTFGGKLYELRKNSAMSQDVLAEKLELQVHLKLDIEVQLPAVVIHSPIPAQTDILRPLVPAFAAEEILQGHKQGVILQPPAIFLPESLEYINEGAFKNLKSLKEVQFGNQVISIGDNAFENCTNLRSITLPDSLEIIGPYAFYKCTNLKEVHLGAGLLEIDGYAFSECTSLRSIVIPDSVESIFSYAFSNCSNLQEVQLGPNVESLIPAAFGGCSRLKTIHFNGTQEQYDSMDKFGHTNWTDGQGWEEWIAEKRIEILFAEEEVGS